MFESIVSRLSRGLAKGRKARSGGLAKRALRFESLEGRRLLTASTAATAFTLTGVPAIVTAGVSETLTLTAVDSLGQPATGYVGTVKFTTTDGKMSIPANVSFSPLTGDSQTLHVTFKTAGPETLTATDTVSVIH